MWEAADNQLTEQVREVALAWMKVWGDVPGIQYFSESLMHIGHKLDEELRADPQAQEEVQPFPANAAD